MSLINNMLKDLDKRNQQPQQVPYIAISNPQRATPFLPLKPFIAALLLITLAGVVTYSIKHKRTPVHQLVKMLPAETNTAPTMSPTTDLAWLKPVSINGITLQVKDNITELTFLLDHAALYRLISDDLHNQVTLIIDHAELLTALPATTVASAIQHITEQTVQGDTQFQLTLYPGAAIKYVNLNTENKNPELVIAIETTTPATPRQSTNTSMLKTPAMRDLLFRQYQQALTAANNGEYQAAINDLASLVKMAPEYKDARVSLVALLMDQGKFYKAKEYLNEGLRLSPENSALIELKARALTNEGKIKEALAILQNAPPPLADNPEYHAFLAALYERSNNDTLAISIYRQLVELNSQNGNWWFGLGVSLDKLGRTQEAADAYTTAVSEGHLSSASVAYLQKRLQTLQESKNDVG